MFWGGRVLEGELHFLLALTGAFPALAAMAYIDRLDAKRPEPIRSLRMVALAGVLSALPAVFFGTLLLDLGIDLGLPPVWLAVWTAFLAAALVEESGKALCVRMTVWGRPEFDERMDGIVYATRAGLGFALVENVVYLNMTEGMETFLEVYLGRAILAVPMHAIAAGFMGYYAARKRFDHTGPGWWGGLAWALFLHGTYDVAIFLGPIWASDSSALQYVLFAVPVLIVTLGGVALRRMARTAVRLDDMATALTGKPSTRLDQEILR